jgi:hypothetical protein
MAHDLQLLKVVAFDANGQAVLTPLSQGKHSGNEPTASVVP